MNIDKIIKSLAPYKCGVYMKSFESDRVNAVIFDLGEGKIYLTDDVRKAVKEITGGNPERKEDLTIYK